MSRSTSDKTKLIAAAQPATGPAPKTDNTKLIAAAQTVTGPTPKTDNTKLIAAAQTVTGPAPPQSRTRPADDTGDPSWDRALDVFTRFAENDPTLTEEEFKEALTGDWNRAQKERESSKK